MDSIVVFSHLRALVVPRPHHLLRRLALSIETGRALAAPLFREPCARTPAVVSGTAPVHGGPGLSSGTPPRAHPLHHG